jgi:hypothetical protein
MVLIDMNALARAGAEVRLAELTAEMTSLNQAFHGLSAEAATRRVPVGPSTSRQRRQMSTATKAKLRAAWARRKASSRSASQPAAIAATAPTKKRPTMSAAGKARIAAAQRKRWAAIRKAKKKAATV